MGDEPATQPDLAAEDRSEDAGDDDSVDSVDDAAGSEVGEGVDDDASDRVDNEIVHDIVEGESEPETTWIADGEKYRCPECQAVHEEPAGSCDVCGWVPG